MPDIPEGSRVIVWRNDMNKSNDGGLMGIGRTASEPTRAEDDILADGVGAVVEANNWYVEIELIESFCSPPVHLSDLRREFSGTDFLTNFEGHRINCNYPIDSETFQRIRQMALPTTRDEFDARTRGMPRSTEVERLTVERVGQPLFRRDLLRYWHGRCSITGLAVEALLRASHARPWACCENDNDRLDQFNGLLLSANLDAAFENGLIGVNEDGTILISDRLDGDARNFLHLDRFVQIEGLDARHLPWLTWHRTNKFD